MFLIPLLILGGFKIAVIPDTQHYSLNDPNTFFAQINYINSDEEIIFAIHEGDLVDQNTTDQWLTASTAMNQLSVPFSVSTGNHDDSSWFLIYFPEFTLDNFHLLGEKFLILNLRNSPGVESIQWAYSVLSTYPERIGILTTHQIIDCSGNFGGQGQFLWDSLKSCPNLKILLCGHHAYSGGYCEFRRTENGKEIILSDYQNIPKPGGSGENGAGWLRLLEFNDNQCAVRAFTPILGIYRRNEFIFEYFKYSGLDIQNFVNLLLAE